MQLICKSRWLLLVTVLPLASLLSLGYFQYALVETLLPEESLQAWWDNGLVLTGLIAVWFTVSIALDAARRPLGWLAFAALFASVVSYLVWTLWHIEAFLPWNLPRWLGGAEYPWYVLALGMPSVLYSLLGYVHLTTSRDRSYRAAPGFLSALIIPLLVYVAGQWVIPAINLQSENEIIGYLVVPLIVATTVFLFLLVRGTYIMTLNRATFDRRGRALFLVVVTIVLPLLGLAVNNRLLDFDIWWSSGDSGGLFGDFRAPVFYVLALVNGLYCSLPRRNWLVYRLPLFLVGSAGLAFLLYFVLVMLPFLPFSILAVLLAGVGVLMLSPLLVLAVQLSRLRDDLHFLIRYIPVKAVMGGAALSFALLPAAVTREYIQDRLSLQRALEYVYTPAQVDGPVDPAATQRVIAHVRSHRDSGGWSLSGNGQPYLSRYYAWIVLDNLTLSEEKLNLLERVFLGAEGPEEDVAPATSSGPAVELFSARAVSNWDEPTRAWQTWVYLDLAADSAGWGSGEYSTTFALPPGAYIDDYYLYVGERREHGLLAERRSATWVYRQVTAAGRDPGLLRYVAADRLQLDIFPFAAGEVRRSGFRVIHREPFRLDIDDRSLPLGRPGKHLPTAPILDGGVTYVPRSLKSSLPVVSRQPRIYYVIDASRRDPFVEEQWIDRVRTSASALPAGYLEPRIVLAGTLSARLDATEDWADSLRHSAPGGFFAQRAVEEILGSSLRDTSREYPVIVVAGANPVFTDELSAFTLSTPEGRQLYSLNPDLAWTHLFPDGKQTGPDSVPLPGPSSVYAYPDTLNTLAYLARDDRPGLLLDVSTRLPWSDPTAFTPWRSALGLQAQYLSHRRAGDTGSATWLKEVRGSFRTGVLMPSTALIVLENEAQKTALLRRQEEVLSADPHFDLEETRQMSEPPIWVLLLLLLPLGILLPRLDRLRGHRL